MYIHMISKLIFMLKFLMTRYFICVGNPNLAVRLNMQQHAIPIVPLKSWLDGSIFTFQRIHILHSLNSCGYNNYQTINPIIILYDFGHKYWYATL
jgi:hypothetical protein